MFAFRLVLEKIGAWFKHGIIMWTMIWDIVTTFLKDVAETYYWDVVGYFIWDVPATSLGRTDRRHLDVVTIMKSFDQKFRIVPQKKSWNDLKKLFSAFLKSMLLLKERMSVMMKLPSWQKSYIKLWWRDPG